MHFAFFERVSGRARSATGANLCLRWLQEKLLPDLVVRIWFFWLEVYVPYSSHNQNSVLRWLPGALIIPLVNFSTVYAYSAAERTGRQCKPFTFHICGLLWDWKLFRCIAFYSASALEQFSFSRTVCANSLVEVWFCLTLSMRLGGLGHSPVLPSIPLGEWREINGCRRRLRLQADWVLLWKGPSLLLIVARAEGIAERGRIQGTAVQAFKHAAEKDAGSLYGVSWFGSCCGGGIQNHTYIGWQGHYFIVSSS